jgi:hypothetical protein
MIVHEKEKVVDTDQEKVNFTQDGRKGWNNG